MAKKKATTQDLYNARRRAKNALKKLESVNIRKLPNKERKLYAQFKRDLKSAISNSYGKQKNIDDTIAKLDTYAAPAKGTISKKDRRNAITGKRINNGMASDFADARKKAYFYRATQRLWDGAPPSERNRIIADAFGGDLQKAWEYVFNNKRVKKALADVDAKLKPIEGETIEAQAFYNDVTDIQIVTSPDFTPIRFKKK